MKILLVYPGTLDGQGRPVKYRKAYLPPLSLATIAGLTPRQHTVRVVNDVAEDIDYTADCDLVGLTAVTSQAGRAYQIADEFRRRGTKVVFGGIHASMLPEEVKAHADAVVVGEAENIWAEVLADCEANRLKDFYQDCCHPDLERAVIPRWDCFNMQVYPRKPGSSMPLMPVFTTRGCPYGCRFCSVTQFMGKTYRTRPIASVLSEIDGTGAKEFFFVDDNIAAKPDYSRELFEALTARGLRWMSQASTTIVKTPDLLERAAKAGCFALFLGVESLNKDSLAGIHKSFNKTGLYEELIERMRQAGIVPFLSFVFGFDEDLEDQFETTIRFLTKNRVGSAIFWILTPLPGTELYQEMQQAGRLISANWSEYDGTHVVFQPKTKSAAGFSEHYWNSFRKLYKPSRILRNIVWNARFSSRPWEAFVRGAFYQSVFWLKLRQGDHPYSPGIGRLPSA